MLQYLINGLVLSSFYILISVGLTLIYGVMKVLHIAHGAVYTIGAYASLAIFLVTHNIILTLIIGSCIGSIASLVIHEAVYERLLATGASRVSVVVASIGVYILMKDTFRLLFGPYALSYPILIGNLFGKVELSTATLTLYQVFIILSITLIILGLWFFLNKSKEGLALKATAQDAEMASALGINVRRVRFLTSLLSGLLAGYAGSVVGIYYNSIERTMGDLAITQGLAIIVLGGMGSVLGAVLASFILGMVETLTVAFIPTPIPPYLISFPLLIAILVLRPTGLLRSKG